MKKIHILGVALVAMLAIGVVGAVSASAATLQWLVGGAALTAALAAGGDCDSGAGGADPFEPQAASKATRLSAPQRDAYINPPLD